MLGVEVISEEYSIEALRTKCMTFRRLMPKLAHKQASSIASAIPTLQQFDEIALIASSLATEELELSSGTTR